MSVFMLAYIMYGIFVWALGKLSLVLAPES